VGFCAAVAAAQGASTPLKVDDQTRAGMRELASKLSAQGDRPEALKNLDALTSCTPEAAGLLAAVLETDDPELIRPALDLLSALAASPDERAGAAVAEALPSLSGRWRPQIVRALGERTDLAAVPHLVAMMKSDKRADADAAFRALSETARRTGAGKGFVERVVKEADPTTPDIRIKLAAVVGWTGDPAAIPYLVFLLDDPDAKVRSRAVRAFVELSRKGATGKVVEALQRRMDESSAGEKATLIGLLGEAGGADVLSLILPYLDDENPDLRKAAADGVFRMTDEAAFDAGQAAIVERIVNEDDPKVVKEMARRIGPRAGEAGAKALLHCLASADPEVRKAAARQLYAVTGEGEGRNSYEWRKWGVEKGYGDPGRPVPPEDYVPPRSAPTDAPPVDRAWVWPYVAVALGGIALAVGLAWLRPVLIARAARKIETGRRKFRWR